MEIIFTFAADLGKRRRGQCPLFYCFKMIDKNYIAELVNQKLEGTDHFLVEVKFSPSRIAVFIDKPTGITIGECSDMHRYLYNALEGKNILETHELEVSSPGMSEPLKVYQQYQRRLGKELQVIDASGKVIKGLLKSAGKDQFTLDSFKIVKEGKKKVTLQEEHMFSYAQIKEAKLIF